MIKFCVRTCYFGKQNSTLGSVVPLAMFTLSGEVDVIGDVVFIIEVDVIAIGDVTFIGDVKSLLMLSPLVMLTSLYMLLKISRHDLPRNWCWFYCHC